VYHKHKLFCYLNFCFCFISGDIHDASFFHYTDTITCDTSATFALCGVFAHFVVFFHDEASAGTFDADLQQSVFIRAGVRAAGFEQAVVDDGFVADVFFIQRARIWIGTASAEQTGFRNSRTSSFVFGGVQAFRTAMSEQVTGFGAACAVDETKFGCGAVVVAVIRNNFSIDEIVSRFAWIFELYRFVHAGEVGAEQVFWFAKAVNFEVVVNTGADFHVVTISPVVITVGLHLTSFV